MRNRNLWVILIAALLVAAALVAAAVLPTQRHQFAQSQDQVLLPDSQPQSSAEEPTAEPIKEPTAPPTSTPTAEPTASPTVSVMAPPTVQAPTTTPAESAGVTITETSSATAAVSTPLPDVKAYLLVTVRGMTYQPIPLYEEHDYTIRQTDGSENVIHVTADSVCMKSSTCENQDCVQQGTVTVENYKERILYNMILCLPNQVYLELYSPEDFATLLAQWAEEDTQAAQ